LLAPSAKAQPASSDVRGEVSEGDLPERVAPGGADLICEGIANGSKLTVTGVRLIVTAP